MATDKNARFEQESWVHLRPQCHPESTWKISHSPSVGIYNFQCAECGNGAFKIMLQPRQW